MKRDELINILQALPENQEVYVRVDYDGDSFFKELKISFEDARAIEGGFAPHYEWSYKNEPIYKIIVIEEK